MNPVPAKPIPPGSTLIRPALPGFSPFRRVLPGSPGRVLSACLVLLLTTTGCLRQHTTDTDMTGGQGAAYTRYASGFDADREGDFTMVRVFDPWQKSRNVTFSYLLGEDPSRVPDTLKDVPFITTPVRRVITLSTTHIAMIASLGEAGTIRGVSGADLVCDSAIRSRIRTGRVVDVGYERNLNYERIISLKPDVLFIYGVEGRIREVSDRLVDAGIPVVFCGDYLEDHPLGKAEWVRFFSLFYSKEREAALLFDRIDSSYRALAAMAAHVDKRPRVLTGLPWKDTWYMAGGNSYAAKLIEDAGGRFLWRDTESSEAIPLDIESVFSRAVRADVWINPGAAVSLEDIVRSDERFRELDAVRKGRVYNNNARMNLSGGNDYWESGAVRPDLILADLIRIFHPELMEDHCFIYYRKLK
jgi:iron complex transport system substrate-binding protein